MRIVRCTQGSEEWLSERLGRVTASELDSLISPTWKIRTGDGPRTYLYRKVAEAWLCRTIYGGGAFAMEQGVLLEPEARPWYELTYDCEVKTAGFIVGDDNRCGASPDGLVTCSKCAGIGWTGGTSSVGQSVQNQCPYCFNGFSRGIEIKCAQEVNAVRYAIEGELPDQYQMQVYGSMFVSGFTSWEFLSYHRTLPKFTITVQRDEKKMAIIQQALTEFYERFDEAFSKLNESADEPRVNPFLK